jgi:hypothetical protein
MQGKDKKFVHWSEKVKGRDYSHRCKFEDNIRMDLRGIEWVVLI